MLDADLLDAEPLDAELPDAEPPDMGCEPSEEECDGRDNDCDGRTDEGFALGTPCFVGVGVCTRRGEQVCLEDEDGALYAGCDVIPDLPTAELCNGLDDDCDGQADEDYPDLGEICAEGVGQCAAEGAWRCNAAGGLLCNATPSEPSDELCNDLDDDCDGQADEGLGLGDPCVVGIGQCADQGARRCDGDGGLTCDATPSPPGLEACDGLDNDCDGLTDEDFPTLGALCVAGAGQCAVESLWRCDEAGGVICDAAPGDPQPEICDGLDNDCDGEADEDLALGDPCEVGEGLCRREGAQICSPEGALACDVAPGAPSDELCNGLDDDCDGQTDEDFPELGGRCIGGLGQCAAEGIWRCDDAGALACDADLGAPAPETCNSVDDDCDGRTDEDFPLGQLCIDGVGQCSRPGVYLCDAEGEAVCSAVGGLPSPERCNAIDDDCDGLTDEDFPDLGGDCAEGVGQCAAEGTWRCDDEGALTCDAAPAQPQPELCNSLDDDCDGAADEDLDLGEICDVGVGACARQGINICDGNEAVICSSLPGQPQAEICNAQDDDCDGVTDEDQPGLGEACTVGVGVCTRAGLNACDIFGGVSCNAQPGAPRGETCNGDDDDCDGHVDEGNVCGPYIASHCRVWLGQAARNSAPAGPSLSFGDCPGSDRDSSGDVRCASTREDSRFRELNLKGDLNDDDHIAIAFTCDDAQTPSLAGWIESRCKVFLGYADNDAGPDNVETWGACPGVDFSNDGALPCTSSGGDRHYRPLPLRGDVDGNDDLAVAFICSDAQEPDRALQMTRSAQVFIGWASSGGNVDDGGLSWSACPTSLQDNSGNERCVSSQGDGRFHRMDLRGDITDTDVFGVGLLSR